MKKGDVIPPPQKKKKKNDAITTTIKSTANPCTGIILGMGLANERRRYYVTPSLIGWAHTQNDDWIYILHEMYSIDGIIKWDW